MTTITTFDPKELEAKVKEMYRSVAENPKGDFHFRDGARDGRASRLCAGRP